MPLVFLLLLLIIAGALAHRTDETAALSRRSAETLEQSDRVLKTVEDANASVVAWLKTGRPSSLDGLDRAGRRLTQEGRRLQELVRGDSAQEARARSLVTLSRELLDVLHAYVADRERKAAAQAEALIASPHTRTVSAAWTATKNAFDQEERTTTIARFAALHRDQDVLGRVLLGVSFVGVVLTLVFSARFGVRIARRLRRLAENAQRLGAGEETSIIEGHDEIADLDRVYHAMTRRLAETVSAYRLEHDVASTLQQALLPQQLPAIPGLRIASAYVPAARGTQIGGDWYDVFTVDEHRIGIGVGDVVGHGLRAATIMGAVRQSIRTAARCERDPSAVLERVNRVLCADEDGAIVTAFFGVFDLRIGTLRYAIAGHPPPLLVDDDGTARPLAGEGLLLGVTPEARFDEGCADLPAGSGLILYTDGIIEIEHDYFKGARDLEDAARAEWNAAGDNVAEAIHRRIFANAMPRDDAAMLVIRITALRGVTEGSDRRVWTLEDARDATAARRLRHEIVAYIESLPGAPADVDAAEIILGEALSNVARHTPGAARIGVARDGDAVLLDVEDRGVAFSMNGHVPGDPFAEGGRGMFLIRAFAQDAVVERTASGNRLHVVLCARVSAR